MERFHPIQVLVIVLTLTNSAFSVIPPFQDEKDFEFGFFESKVNNVPKPESNLTLKVRAPVERSVIPTHYRLQIRPIFDPADSDAERFTIPGSVVIQVVCILATKTVRLDSNEIVVRTNNTRIISQSTNAELRIESQETSDKDESFEIKLVDSLQKGETYQIHIQYTAPVFRDRLNGIYLSNYTNPSTKEIRYLATSHFEPVDARQAFPSFDEPDLKATFEISIGRREKYSSLCNMDLSRTEPIDGMPGWYWDHYQTTVKMSTYLIAVVVSDFTSETADSSRFGGKPVKIWGASHYIDQQGGVYAAETAAKILEFYQSYFGAKYPLPKMDSVAVPHFSAGAMENFGLNTYREKYLMYIDGKNTELDRYGICSVIGHELAHQWFGDLVTCKTWSQLWLNEGFAAYVQNIGATAACPEFEAWDMFVPSTLQTAFIVDQSSETHPIVNDTTYNVARFSKITYNKGASLIRMMQGFLGEETLRKGLQNYLKEFSFGNAHQEDLFDALTDAARKDGTISNYTSVNEIMDSWTHKQGFPLVRVDIAGENKIYLSQELYVKKSQDKSQTKGNATKTEKTVENGNELWWIPIKIATKAKPEFGNRRIDFWIPSHIGTFLRSKVDTGDWLIVNPDSVGYFRVLYDPVLTKRLQNQLNTDSSVISSNTRSQLLDDYFSFAFADYINIESALDMTTYLSKEIEFNAWSSVLRQLKRTANLFSNTPAFPNFQKYLQPKINSALNSIGYEQKAGAQGITVLNRVQLLAWANILEDPQLHEYASRIFTSWVESPSTNSIPLDVQPTVYCAAVGSGINEDSTWNFVLKRYSEESAGRQKDLLLNALSCSKNSDRIQELLYLTLETKKPTIQRDDIQQLLQRITANSVGRQMIFPFIQKEYEALSQFHNGTKVMASVLSQLASYIHEDNEYNDLQTFLEVNEASLKRQVGGEGLMSKVVPVVEENRAWVVKFYDPMNAWFAQHISEA